MFVIHFPYLDIETSGLYKPSLYEQMQISSVDFTQIHETVSLNLRTPTDTEVLTYKCYIIIN